MHIASDLKAIAYQPLNNIQLVPKAAEESQMNNQSFKNPST